MDMKLAKTAGVATNPVSTPPNQVPDEQSGKALELKKQLEASIQQIADSTQYSQYLSMEDQAKLATEKMMLEADLALINTFLQTGEWDPAAEPSVDVGAIQQAIAKMDVGWNDMGGKLTPEKTTNGVYEVTLPTSGVYDPANPKSSNALAFVVPENAVKIVAKTVGNDIQMTVFKSDKTSQVYLLKDMAVRPERIYIYGAQKQSALTADFSKAFRVSNGQYGQPFGDTNGFVIWGTQSHDTITGSSGNDIIVGGGGNDLLQGLSGDDEIYGDGFGTGQFHDTDGDDILDGGAGMDVLRAGGGSKDKIIKGVGDSSAEGEKIETEHFSTLPGNALTAPNWTQTTNDAGEVELTFDDDSKPAGAINLTLPPGYTMAAGSMDSTGQALVITLVGFDANGKPQTAQVRINDFFDPDVKTTLNVYGNQEQNILDFHSVTLTGNMINLHGEQGNDTLLAPRSYLDELGIDLSQLGKGTYSNKKLKALVGLMRDANGQLNYGGTAWNTAQPNADAMEDASYINAKGEIELQTDGEMKNLSFDLPPGFTDSVLMQDGDDYKLILINRMPDSVQQVVVRIVGGVSKVKGAITMDGVPIPVVGATPTMDGGAGADTLFGSPSSVTFTPDATDTVIKGSYQYNYTAAPASTQTKTDQIASLETDIGILDKKIKGAEKEKAEADTTDERKAELDTKIADWKKEKEGKEDQKKALAA